MDRTTIFNELETLSRKEKSVFAQMIEAQPVKNDLMTDVLMYIYYDLNTPTVNKTTRRKQYA